MADPFIVTRGGLGVTMRLLGLELSKKRNLKLTPALTRTLAQLLTIAALNVTTKAKGRAPVDTGRLRSAIFPNFTEGKLVAEVRARTRYAAFVEFGTGPLGASTNAQTLPPGYVHGPRYFPPPKALERWAERHGVFAGPFARKNLKAQGGLLVAKKIFYQGGTEAKPFLGPAFEEESRPLVEKMQAALNQAAQEARK